MVHVASTPRPQWHPCARPLPNEIIVADMIAFERVVNVYSLVNLMYVGYPLSEGVLWGSAAGFGKYYSLKRYLKYPGIFTPRSLHAGTNPNFYVVEGR